MTGPKKGWPAVVQVAGFVLGCVLAAQAISLGIVFLIPPPELPPFALIRVVDVAKGGEDSDFDRQILSEPPIAETPDGDQLPSLIADSLAFGLEAARQDVRVSMLGEFGQERAFNSTPMVTIVKPKQMNPGVAAPPDLDRAFLDPKLKFKAFITAVRQTDGSWLVVQPRESLINAWQRRFLWSLAIAVAVLTPFVILFSQLLTNPIRSFAQAAETFGLNPALAPLKESGGMEVRSAIGTFNRMQARLKRHLDDRTEMIAAIAHDLRTPLTSLRFRAENVQPHIRDRMIADIERLNAMIEQVLAFVSGDQTRERHQRVDVGELVAACARESSDGGSCVTWTVEPDLVIQGEAVNLRRAVTNLIDNAVKFAGGAKVFAEREGGRIVIRVEDDGLGVPEDMLEQVFEPFQRVDMSRNRTTGGVGLGLALVRSVVHAHKGEVSIRNRAPHGLCARVSLPAA